MTAFTCSGVSHGPDLSSARKRHTTMSPNGSSPCRIRNHTEIRAAVARSSDRHSLLTTPFDFRCSLGGHCRLQPMAAQPTDGAGLIVVALGKRQPHEHDDPGRSLAPPKRVAAPATAHDASCDPLPLRSRRKHAVPQSPELPEGFRAGDRSQRQAALQRQVLTVTRPGRGRRRRGRVRVVLARGSVVMHVRVSASRHWRFRGRAGWRVYMYLMVRLSGRHRGIA